MRRGRVYYQCLLLAGIAFLAWCLIAPGVQAGERNEIEDIKKRLEELEKGPEGSVFELLKSIQVSGFVDTTFNWNFNRPKAPRENRLRIFDRPANTFSLNLVEISLEKEAAELNS